MVLGRYSVFVLDERSRNEEGGTSMLGKGNGFDLARPFKTVGSVTRSSRKGQMVDRAAGSQMTMHDEMHRYQAAPAIGPSYSPAG